MKTKKNFRVGFLFKDHLVQARNSIKHISQVRQSGEHRDWEEVFLPNYKAEEIFQPPDRWRLTFVSTVFLLVFFGLFLRLFHLQVVTGDQYKLQADSNRVQIRLIHAPRGIIYDRNYKILAQNNPAFRFKEEVVSRDDALVMEAKEDARYRELEIDTVRFYPYGIYTSHVLGYVGQISPDELNDPGYAGYLPGDRIGRAGLEQYYESILRGKDGAEVIEVDSQGRKIRTIRVIEPVPGKNLHLSLDIDLQKVTFDALEKGVVKMAKSCCGAAVVANPGDGDILALASYPGFDSNVFTDPSQNDKISSYFSDKDAPMLNRAIAGVYPPGSTFKITSSLAGLSSGKIKKETKIEDTGVVTLGEFKYTNWLFTSNGRTDGMVDVIKGLQRSNDIFYYRLGEMVGEKVIADTARSLGMGKRLGIDLPGEEEGLIPSDQWKRDNTGEPWYPGDTLHFSIGQGFILVTPLQIMTETAYIANNGVLEKPHFVTKVSRPDGKLYKEISGEVLVQDLYKSEHISLIKQGLGLVTKPGGTAWPFFTFSVPSAGKTGTAEYGDAKGKTHAWYTAYAPEDNPTVVATVLIEAGGEGSSVSAPAVKEIFTWYFNEDKTNIKSLDTASVATESVRLRGE